MEHEATPNLVPSICDDAGALRFPLFIGGFFIEQSIHVPMFECVVETTTDKPFAVRRERNSVYTIHVPFKISNELRGFCIPDSHKESKHPAAMYFPFAEKHTEVIPTLTDCNLYNQPWLGQRRARH